MDSSESPNRKVDKHIIRVVDLSHSILPFSKRHREVSETFKFHVFLLLKPFISTCYFLLLIPFQFAKNKSTGFYTIKSNIAQKVASTLLISSMVAYSLLDLRYFLEQDLKESPDQAFRFATGLIIHLLPFCWLVTFWIHQSRFCKLLNVCQGKFMVSLVEDVNLKIPNWKHVWVLNIFILVTIIRFSIRCYHYNDGSLDAFVSYASNNLQYNLYMHDEKFRLVEKKDLEKSLLLSISGVVASLLESAFDLIIILFEQFCLTGAMMVYATCEYFVQDLEKLTSSWSTDSRMPAIQSRKSLQNIILNYMDLVSVLETINQVFGNSVLLFFLYSYPLFVWSVFERLRGETILGYLLNLYDMVILILVTGIAATGSEKIEQFKQWLFDITMWDNPAMTAELASLNDDMNKHSSGYGTESLIRLTLLHREVNTESVGLKGSKFFTITFHFIGTMIGIVLTYGIVMLQFVMKPKKDLVDVARNFSCNFSEDEIINLISEASTKMYCNATD